VPDLVAVLVLHRVHSRTPVQLRPQNLILFNKPVQLGSQVVVLNLQHLRVSLERI
jgi:hypothetical protein